MKTGKGVYDSSGTSSESELREHLTTIRPLQGNLFSSDSNDLRIITNTVFLPVSIPASILLQESCLRRYDGFSVTENEGIAKVIYNTVGRTCKAIMPNDSDRLKAKTYRKVIHTDELRNAIMEGILPSKKGSKERHVLWACYRANVAVGDAAGTVTEIV